MKHATSNSALSGAIETSGLAQEFSGLIDSIQAQRVELPFLNNKNGQVRTDANNSSALLQLQHNNSMTADIMQAVNAANLQSQTPLKSHGLESL